MNINFLIRTSYRPQAFARCVNSILTDPSVTDNFECNVNFIVAYDDKRALQYITPSEWYHTMEVEYTGNKETHPFFYNAYFNSMIYSEKIIPGHLAFIDDDDEWREGSFEVLRKFLVPKQSYIFPFIRTNGVQKPTPAMMFAHKIHRGYISFQSLILSTEQRHLIKFDDTEDSDFNGIKMLSLRTPLKWVNKPLIVVSNRAYGKMEK